MLSATSTSTAIDAIEAVTKHDVIAFLTWAGEKLGPERRWLHQGMTSSDVLDTALAVQLKQAADLLIADIDPLLEVLKRRALEHKLTPTIGRSHGIHAEPVTFGLKLAQAYAEFARNRERLDRRARRRRHLRDLRRGRHLRQRPAGGRGACRRRARPDASSRSRPRSSRATATRCSSRRSASSPRRSSGWRSRSATCSAPKCSRPRNISRPARRALGDAAQAQSGADREPHRARPHRPQLRTAGDGERRAVARARHLPLLGRALHRPRRDDHARFRARAAHRA